MATNDVNSNDEELRKLYRAALKGDWKSVKDIPNIQREITKKKETTLHIAAAANKEDFVKNLVKRMSSNELEVVNTAGNTALTYAAATGNVNIAEAMLEKNRDLPNIGSVVKPLFMAALLGHSQMVDHLSRFTRTAQWDTAEQVELFVTYASVGMYGMKVKQDQNSKQTQAHQLLEEICVCAYKFDVEKLRENEEFSQLVFVAAEVGNVEFLIELIRFDFDILWKTDKKRRSIFHIAVQERHESIFYLLNEIGSIKNLIVETTIEDGNNMLHLAAKLAPQHKLNAISGAALQMQKELLWFKTMQGIIRTVSLSYIFFNFVSPLLLGTIRIIL